MALAPLGANQSINLSGRDTKISYLKTDKYQTPISQPQRVKKSSTKYGSGQVQVNQVNRQKRPKMGKSGG